MHIMSLPLKLTTLSLSTLICGIILACVSTADAQSRCRVSDPQLKALSQRLTRAETPQRWRSIYQDARAALSLIEDSYDRLQDHQNSLGKYVTLVAQLRCTQELLFESAFFLSDEKIEGRLWAMRAVGHAVGLSSLSQIPLQSTENRERLQLIIKRVNQDKTKDSRASTLSRSLIGSWSTYYIPAQKRPYRLHIQVTQQADWLKKCGLIDGCKSAIQWRLYTKRSTETSFRLPVGLYDLSWSGPCITYSEPHQFSASLSPVEIITPSMHCYSKISLIDELTKMELPLTRSKENENAPIQALDPQIKLRQDQSGLYAPEGVKLNIKLDGYRDREVTVPLLGALLPISLKRCSVSLIQKLVPKDSTFQGPTRVFWGRPYSIKVSRQGYKTISRTITVPRPASCENASPYVTHVQLPRQIKIEAYAPNGSLVKLSSLKVSGLSISLHQKSFHRPEGRYKVHAQTYGYPELITGVSIPSCIDKDCQPAKLSLRFQSPPPKPTLPAKRLKWVGASMMIMGLSLFGFNALTYQEKEQNLLYTSDLSTIQAKMTTTNQWSVGLLISGGLTTLLGYAWPALTSAENTSSATNTYPSSSSRRNK